jgi:TPR repeat protein
MLLNGIGVEWNPFEAFKFFRNASLQNFAPAQYITGILYTDNLIVPRDWRRAFYWINKSKLNGYSVEEDIIKLLEAKLPDSFKDSLNNKQVSYADEKVKRNSENDSHQEYSSQSIDESIGLSFIDFDLKEKDKSISEEELVRDILLTNIIKDSLVTNVKRIDDFINIYGFENFLALSKYDIPEVLTLLGYLHKEGKLVEKDILKALELFILAIRYDSPRAPFILLDLIQNKQFVQSLKNELSNKNNTAKFVWYGLARFGFIDEIILRDAYELLNEAARNQHVNSINELALNYYVGNYLSKDVQRAVGLWKYAESLGSSEATIRILLSKIFDESEKVDKNIFNSMLNFEEKGSMLAQVALGFSYEKGRGTSVNKALAVKYYRKAAQRGNLFAFERLKNLYDSIRPNLSEFRVN